MQLRTGIDMLAARRTAGLSQGRMAELIGIDRSSLSRIEWSRKQLDPQRTEEIERTLQLAGTDADHPDTA